MQCDPSVYRDHNRWAKVCVCVIPQPEVIIINGKYYINAFSRRFYPKRLFRLYIFYQSVCSLGIEPTIFCVANAMLYH